MALADLLFPEGGANIDVGETASALATLLGVSSDDLADVSVPVEAEVSLPTYVPYLAGALVLSILVLAIRK